MVVVEHNYVLYVTQNTLKRVNDRGKKEKKIETFTCVSDNQIKIIHKKN